MILYGHIFGKRPKKQILLSYKISTNIYYNHGGSDYITVNKFVLVNASDFYDAKTNLLMVESQADDIQSATIEDGLFII